MANNYHTNKVEGKKGYDHQNTSESNSVKREPTNTDFFNNPLPHTINRPVLGDPQHADLRYRFSGLSVDNQASNTSGVIALNGTAHQLQKPGNLNSVNFIPTQSLIKNPNLKRNAVEYPNSSNLVKKEFVSGPSVSNREQTQSSSPFLKIDSKVLDKFDPTDPFAIYLRDAVQDVEMILAKRDNVSQGTTEYLVKWKRLTHEENIWMERQSLACSKLIKIYNDSSKTFPHDVIFTTPYDPSGYRNNELIRNLSYLPTNVYKFVKMVNVPGGPSISIVNRVDDEGPPSDFQYTNKLVYGEGIPKPDKEYLAGCECEGGCKFNPDCGCRGDNGHPYNANGLLTLEPGYGIYECNHNCKCPPDCLHRMDQRETPARLQIFKTENKGWGVKTLNNLKKGTFVGIYLGEIITNEEAEKRGTEYDIRGNSYLFDLDYHSGMDADCEFVIDAYKFGNFTHFFNHSCEPNMTVYPIFNGHQNQEIYKLAFFTSRDIKKQEELCFDYSMNHDADPFNAVDLEKVDDIFKQRNENYKCFCGAKKCRGYVHIF